VGCRGPHAALSQRLLARLVERHAISQDLATKLMAWRHPGFSAHVGEPISADDTQALENLAGYVTRNPLSLQRLVYLDGQQAVIYKGLKHNPTLGRNFETMDPREWLARMADHIPDPGKHRTLFYSYYANRVRGDRAAEEPAEGKVEEEPAKKRRCTASWARLIMPSAGLCRVATGAACYPLDLVAVRTRGRLIGSA